MTLAKRLFLIFGSLVAVLVVAEWWLVRSLALDLGEEMGEVATYVGRAVVARVLPDGRRLVEESLQIGSKPGREDGSSPSFRYQWVEQREESTPTDGDRGGAGLPAGKTGAERQVKVLLGRPGASSGSSHVLHIHGESIPLPDHGLRAALDRFSQKLFLGTFGILGLGLAVAGVVSHRISRPLRELAGAAELLGRGELGAEVEPAGGGEVARAVVSFNQMSRQLQALEAERQVLREQQSFTELGELARGLAHSLRNPLNALGLSLDEIARLDPSGRKSELCERARRQIQHMDQSLRSFLALASNGSAAPERVDLVGLIEDVVLECMQSSAAAGGGCRIQLEKPPKQVADELSLEGVAAECRAAIQALVVNAVEATAEGGLVSVRLSREHSSIRVEVLDEGAGLDHGVRAKLFTPHVTTKANGSGMGLFLAQRIVSTRYQGAVLLEDREGGGTRATITMSQRRTEPGPAKEES